jgi:WD40-like Beta Propeller Repeat
VLAKTLATLAFAFGGIHAGAHQVLHVGYAPAWSPNGLRIAYVTKGNLWVADADGTHQGLIDKDAGTPSWSPNGKQLAFERGGYIWAVRADGADEHRLARGFHPDSAPTGNRIVFDRDGEIVSDSWFGGDPTVFARGEDPAYSPGGTLAFVRDREIVVKGRAVADGTEPAWQAETGRIAYADHGLIYVTGHAGPVVRGTQPAFPPSTRVEELLPDLVQRPPTGLTIARVNADLVLDELRYEHDAASDRIRISWRDGVPSVKLLRSCFDTTVC